MRDGRFCAIAAQHLRHAAQHFSALLRNIKTYARDSAVRAVTWHAIHPSAKNRLASLPVLLYRNYIRSARALPEAFRSGADAAPARDSQSRPGGPGRPSGSHYGEPAIAGHHGRDERMGNPAHRPVYRKRSGDRNRRCVERRQGGASCIGSPSRCGKRTPGEQNVFRTMLTRRQIKNRAFRRSAPSHLCADDARRCWCMAV